MDSPQPSHPPTASEERPKAAAARVLMGGPVALLTVHWRGRDNVLPVSWHTPLSSQPPMIGVALERSRYSTEMVQHAGAFALSIPKRPLLHHVQYLGAFSGSRIDKFEATQLETFTAQTVDAPLLHGCCAWVECHVAEVIPIGDHVLFAGVVTAVRVDPASFSDRWVAADPVDQPLHFLGGHVYSTLHERLEARLPQDAEAPEVVLRERIAEELEVTREARERREEVIGEAREELRRGNAVDPETLAALGALSANLGGDDLLDLSKGIVLG